MFLSSMFLYQLWTFFEMLSKHVGFCLIFLLRILKNISLSFSDKLVVVFISCLLQFEHLPFILLFSFLFRKDRLFPDPDIRISQLLINFVIISNTIIVSLSFYSFFSHTTLIDNGDRSYSISNIDVYLCISPMLSLRVVPRLIVIIHLGLQVQINNSQSGIQLRASAKRSGIKFIDHQYSKERIILFQFLTEPPRMSKAETYQADMNRLYGKLDQLIAQLNHGNDQHFKLNVDVPRKQCANFSINVRNHTHCEHDQLYSEMKEYHSIGKESEKDEHRVYQININDDRKYESVPINFSYSSRENEKEDSTKLYKAASPPVAPPKAPESNISNVTYNYSLTDKDQSQLKNPGKQLQKTWQSSLPYTLQNSPVRTIKRRQNEYIDLQKQTPNYYLPGYQTHSETIFVNTSQKKQPEVQEKQALLSASRKTALEYSNRLHDLNEKLRNSFLKADKIQYVQYKPVLKNKKESFSNTTTLKKVSTQRKAKESPKKPDYNSRCMINSSMCSCQGNRLHRSRQISPLQFNTFDYRANNGQITYRPYRSPKKEVTPTKACPSNCKHLSSSKDMSSFIKDVKAKYKERKGQGRQSEKTVSTEKNKNYTTHRVEKSNSVTPKQKRSSSQSVLPYQAHFHRCIACCCK